MLENPSIVQEAVGDNGHTEMTLLAANTGIFQTRFKTTKCKIKIVDLNFQSIQLRFLEIMFKIQLTKLGE